ncbi:MAG: EamA family transporter [Haloferacaceae archaeon]
MIGLSAPPVVYALALLPAVLWGFAPVFSKRGMAAGGSPLQASLVVVAVDTGLYAVALAVLGGPSVLALDGRTVAIFAGAGLVGTALGRLAVFAGVERLGASVNSAAISARPLFAAAFAVGLLGERVTLPTLAGVVTLAAGLVRLALARGGDVRGWEPRDLAFPLTGAAFFALGNVVRRHALRATETTPLQAVALNEAAALVALGGYALVRTRGDVLNAPRRTYGFFAASGTLTAVALLALFGALALPGGRVVVVDPLAATAPLFTAVFAHFLLDDFERVTRGVVVGATLIVVGAALVTVG